MCFFDYSFWYNFFFFFFAKSMLKFQEKKMFFRLIHKYSSFVYFSSRKAHFFVAPEVEWPAHKAIVERSAFEGFSMRVFSPAFK